MACSDVLWDEEVIFEDGSPCVVHATIHQSGRCHFVNTDRQADYAELWAEFWEEGGRAIVKKQGEGQGFMMNRYGQPMAVQDDGRAWPVAAMAVMNRPKLVIAGMDENPEWGLF